MRQLELMLVDDEHARLDHQIVEGRTKTNEWLMGRCSAGPASRIDHAGGRETGVDTVLFPAEEHHIGGDAGKGVTVGVDLGLILAQEEIENAGDGWQRLEWKWFASDGR